MLKSTLCSDLEISRKDKLYKIETGDNCVHCVNEGKEWVHLRTCLTCGITLCCDSSEARHASRHAKETGHPVVVSAELNEDWAYCYVHEQLWMIPEKLK